MSKIWSFRALDTLFLRDGTPLNQEDPGSVHPRGLFPPMMNTLQGAIRTLLAVEQGWDPGSKAPLPALLGDTDHLGELRLSGPWISLDGKRLYPAPLVLFGKKKENGEWDLVRLAPGEPVNCDLGENVRLPSLPHRVDGGKLLEQVWLTRNGMEKVLAGGVPDTGEIHEADTLWGEEYRVGIELQRETRTVKEGHLYTLTHVRPGREVRVEAGVDGIPADWHPKGKRGVPLGGEGRFAELEVSEPGEAHSLPRLPKLEAGADGKIRFTVTLLTPGKFDRFSGNDVQADPAGTRQAIVRGPLEEEFAAVSASIGKLVQIGGWDLKNKQPRPLIPFVPAGSTWFYEAPADRAGEIAGLHGSFVGVDMEYGYGQIAIGVWHEQEGHR